MKIIFLVFKPNVMVLKGKKVVNCLLVSRKVQMNLERKIQCLVFIYKYVIMDKTKMGNMKGWFIICSLNFNFAYVKF